ncbi:hypothetical protein [Herbiconiux solani]|uniref:hypothetical protein n=1 Tax=Herbiconiux solani TaxID=661329 RepID=UPI0008250679|nr:hypothetical protein [Herbiconiux solani]
MNARRCEDCGLLLGLVGLDRNGEIYECSLGHRVTVPTELAAKSEALEVALGERDRARELAVKLEEQLALIEEIVVEPMDFGVAAAGRILRIRDILGAEVRA